MCACDLALWRNINPDWPADTLVRSVSPTTLAAPQATRTTLVVGQEDTITPPALSERYVAHLAHAGTPVALHIVRGDDRAGNRALSAAWLRAVFNARDRVATLPDRSRLAG